MAGIATAQAEVVATNIRTLITGDLELARYQKFPPLIAVPLGPEGGAGVLGDGVADAKTIAKVKGRDLLVGRYADLFNVVPAEVAEK